jgi:hypothetical protein
MTYADEDKVNQYWRVLDQTVKLENMKWALEFADKRINRQLKKKTYPYPLVRCWQEMMIHYNIFRCGEFLPASYLCDVNYVSPESRRPKLNLFYSQEKYSFSLFHVHHSKIINMSQNKLKYIDENFLFSKIENLILT